MAIIYIYILCRFKKVEKSINMLRRNMEDTKNSNGISRDENTVSEMKYTLGMDSSRLDTAERKIGELEIIALGNIQTKTR